MPGTYEEKFAGVRSFLAYMMAHPGKKLLFMGQEFGQFIEWNSSRSLTGCCSTTICTEKLKEFSRTLNRFYKRNPAMWEIDYSWRASAGYPATTAQIPSSPSAAWTKRATS